MLLHAWSTTHDEPCEACCRDLYDSQLAQLVCPASRAVSRLLTFWQQCAEPAFFGGDVLSMIADRTISSRIEDQMTKPSLEKKKKKKKKKKTNFRTPHKKKKKKKK